MTTKSQNASTVLMSSFTRVLILLPLLLLLLLSSQHQKGVNAQDCPNECSCFNNFATCFEFTSQNLLNLPTNLDTLVLNGGDIVSFPPGFARRFPQLTLLEIQATRIQTILNDTFSGLSGLDQLALSDCQIETIDSGAFEDISAVSKILFSGSQIGTIRSGAFSKLSNIAEFSIWSSQMERVESRAFSHFSELGSLAFYLNNVTTWNRNAFADIENLGKVDVYMNKFFNARGSAVMPLQAATGDMNMYSNTFPCNCGVAQDFNTPLLKRYLVSQKCTEDRQVFRLSEVDLDQLCSGQPSSTPSTTSSSTSSTVGTTTKSTTTPKEDLPTFETTTPIKVTKTVYLTSSPRNGRESSTTSTTPSSRPSSSTSFPTTTTTTSRSRRSSTDSGVTRSGEGQSSGQNGNSSSGAPSSTTQVTFVLCLTNILALVWVTSVWSRNE